MTTVFHHVRVELLGTELLGLSDYRFLSICTLYPECKNTKQEKSFVLHQQFAGIYNRLV